MTRTVSQRDIELVGLKLAQANVVMQKNLAEWFEREPEAAKEAIHGTARIIRLASSVTMSPDDPVFLQECADLIFLSLMHPETRDLFETVTRMNFAQARIAFLTHDKIAYQVQERLDQVRDRLAIKAIYHPLPSPPKRRPPKTGNGLRP